MRVPIRHAESCVAADRQLAASLASRLDGAAAQSTVGWTARAASRAAAGEAAEAGEALARAAAARTEHQTYYGDAWEALGRYLLLDDRLGGCPPEVKFQD